MNDNYSYYKNRKLPICYEKLENVTTAKLSLPKSLMHSIGLVSDNRFDCTGGRPSLFAGSKTVNNKG